MRSKRRILIAAAAALTLIAPTAAFASGTGSGGTSGGTGGGGTGGGGGGGLPPIPTPIFPPTPTPVPTPPPTPSPSPTPTPVSTTPCASITPSSILFTRTFVGTQMDTTITSCAAVTMTDLVVVWDPGPPGLGVPSPGCVLPQGTAGVGFSLSPGASLKVSCRLIAENSGTFVSGTGTVSVYGNCEAYYPGGISMLDPSLSCSQVPSSLLAQAPYSWSYAIPAVVTQPNLPSHRG